jgi:hypothetical protein
VRADGLLTTKRNKFLHLMKKLYPSWLVQVMSENYSDTVAEFNEPASQTPKLVF